MTDDGINAAAALARRTRRTRRTRRIARQSVLTGMGMSLAAIGVAAAGLLPARMGRAAARSH